MNESLTEAVHKRYQEAGFTNDLIFKQVLRNNPDILQEVLQICIPGIDASAFTIAESEHEIIVSIGNKRIRLDLITKSQSGDKVVDLEMFTYDPDLPMYARYAGSMLDCELPIGALAKELPEQILLIFCTFDPMGGGDPVYRRKISLDGREDLRYTEKRIAIYFSPTAIEKAPENLRPFLYLLKGAADTSDPLVRRISDAVTEVKRDGEFRRTVMDQFEKEAAMRRAFYEEARAELAEEITQAKEEVTLAKAEADKAKAEVNQAKSAADQAKAEADQAKAEANQAKLKAEENLKKGIRSLLYFGHTDEEIHSVLMSEYSLSREESEVLLRSVKMPS